MTLLTVDQLPFVKNLPHDGRLVHVLPYFDATTREWHVYIEIEPSKFAKFSGIPYRGTYLSAEPQDPSADLVFFLGTFVTQHISFQGINGPFHRIVSDIQNFASVLEKYHVISLRPREQRQSAGDLLETEVEYTVSVIRSLYDLLQKLAKNAAALVRFPNALDKRVFQNLPDSFAAVCIEGDNPRTAESISDRWGLLPPIATFYAAEADRFLRIRNLRDSIVHHGNSMPSFFDLEDGVAVSPNEAPWSQFGLWGTQTLGQNGLGSLRAFIAYLIADSIDLMSRFVKAYWSCVATPQAIDPTVRCFVRGPFVHHLLKLQDYIANPWERKVIAKRDGA